MFLTRCVEVLRHPRRDRARARRYIEECAGAAARAELAAYDTPIDENAPSIYLGSMHLPSGDELPVRLPVGAASHTGVLGSTGSGKTSFFIHWFLELLRLGIGVALIDCKHDLFDPGLRWLAALAHRRDEKGTQAFVRSFAVINWLSTGALTPFNLCFPVPGWTREVQASEVATLLGGLFDGGLTFPAANVLTFLIRLLMEHSFTLAEAAGVLADDCPLNALAVQSTDEGVRDFFLRIFPQLPVITRQVLTARLQSLVQFENFKLMLGADKCLDFQEMLDGGKPMLVSLAKGGGAPEEPTGVMAALLLNRMFQAAYAAGSRRVHPYYFMADEFYHVLTPALSRRFATALTTLRSYKVGLTLILHNLALIEPTLRETLIANCDGLAVFRTTASAVGLVGDFLPDYDAALMAEALRRTGMPPTRAAMRRVHAERLQRLATQHCYWFDRRRPHPAVLLRVPDVFEPHKSLGISAGALDRFIADYGIADGGIALPRETLQRQIAARAERLRAICRPPIRIRQEAGPERTVSDVSMGTVERRPRRRLG